VLKAATSNGEVNSHQPMLNGVHSNGNHEARHLGLKCNVTKFEGCQGSNSVGYTSTMV